MIDLHCHIDLYKNPKSVLERADQAGIYVLSVTTTPKAWCGTKKMAEGYKRVRTALGLHPQLAHERYNELSLFEKLLPEVQYVGEIGLDKGKNYKAHYARQEYVFNSILKMLNSCDGKIMSIHSTYAVDEVLSTLEKYPKAGPAILHWFSGSIKQMERAVSMGCWFSVGPKMLQSEKGKALISKIPLNKILLETDGPFVEKDRSHPFEPIDTINLAKKLAYQKNISEKEVRQTILRNFKHLTTFNQT